MKTNKQLRKLIHTVLDCGTHFNKPTIIQDPDDFQVGPGAIVICEQCVKRLREAIDLKPGEDAGSPYQFEMKERERRKAQSGS